MEVADSIIQYCFIYLSNILKFNFYRVEIGKTSEMSKYQILYDKVDSMGSYLIKVFFISLLFNFISNI